MQGAGTSAHVVLELWAGEGGGEGVAESQRSGVHCLEQGPYQPVPFGPGQTDAFEVRPFQPPDGHHVGEGVCLQVQAVVSQLYCSSSIAGLLAQFVCTKSE